MPHAICLFVFNSEVLNPTVELQEDLSASFCIATCELAKGTQKIYAVKDVNTFVNHLVSNGKYV
jgi:hypothetical protein